MQQNVVDSVTLDGSVIQDLSVWGLFIESDVVVKIVIVILLIASFWSWAIIFDKVLRMRRLRVLAEQF